MNHTITETIFSAKEYDDKWPPNDLRKFYEWVKIFMEEIPDDCLESASIHVGSDGSCAEITIQYERQKTAEDIQAEIITENARRIDLERRERRILKELYERYGAP